MLDSKPVVVIDCPIRPQTHRLPEGAGPADWWLAILLDESGPTWRRDQAARELGKLGDKAVKAAQRRREVMEAEEWFGSLSLEEQRRVNGLK